MLKKGDLVRSRTTDRLATVIRDEYNKVFYGPEDEEMMAHGMGEYAGIYGRAIDICYVDTAERVRGIDARSSHFEVMSPLDILLTTQL
jgi:hypothetical protein